MTRMRAWQRRDDSALGEHATRPGSAHDTVVRAIEEFYRDRDSLLRQTCPVGKKNDPGNWGVTSI